MENMDGALVRKNMYEGVVMALDRIDCLAANAITEASSFGGYTKDLKKLQLIVAKVLKAMMEDDVKGELTGKEIEVREGLKRLKRLTYEVEDIFDGCITKVKMAQIQNKNKKIVIKVRNIINLSFYYKQARKIRCAIKDIEAVMGRFISNNVITDDDRQTLLDQNRQGRLKLTRPIEPYDEIIGRGEERNKLKQLLLGHSVDQQQGVSVLPIVGMGGIGKTTLAKLLFHDDDIMEHFDLRIWVYVSLHFDLKKIFRDIVKSLTEYKYEISNMDSMIAILKKAISRKRFLLVLDDVWNADYDEWQMLKNSLTSDVNGSSIIITTRTMNVASIVGTIPPFFLEPLTMQDAWWLFRSQAREEHLSPQFDAIGKQIVHKFGGLPITIKFVGGLLYHTKDLYEWLYLLQRIRDVDYDLMSQLQNIMYDLLPLPLIQCLSYCSVFPMSCVIEKKKLIQMWMAQGLLQISLPVDDAKILNNVEKVKLMIGIGEEYFNVLVSCSILQVVEYDELKGVCGCEMHDLMHDLATSIFAHECYDTFIMSDDDDVPKPQSPASLLKGGKSRLFINHFSPDKKFDTDQILKFKFLRVLDLGCISIEGLPFSIGKLKRLRYFGLSSDRIKVLPDSITNLYNLQTLRLKNCSELVRLPKDMRKLINLVHLEIDGCPNLIELPGEIGLLTLLQTLPFYKVGKDSGHGIGELNCLSIAGELNIENLENVENKEDANNANLKEKQNIHTLKFSWLEKINNAEVQSDILEGLQPHSNLKILEINNFMGHKFPTWMNASLLPRLVKLFMNRCNSCTHLPPLGQLLMLRVLSISCMDSVSCIEKSFYGVSTGTAFPSLEELKLWNMYNLREWVKRADCFPCLRRLDVSGSPMLRRAPTLFPALEELILRRSTSEALRSITGNLSSLISLQIYGIPDMEYLPQGLLQRNAHLQSVEIHNCTLLRALPAEELQQLSSLEELIVGGYAEDQDCFPADGIKCLHSSLQKLEIIGWPKLKSLGEEFQYLTALKQLTIRCCDGLEAFPEWLGNLSSLQSLMIFNCGNLMCLPQSIKSLTELKRLEIEDCQHLLESCAKERGEDWDKIADIPCVILD